MAELQGRLATVESRLAEGPRGAPDAPAEPVEAALVSWALSRQLAEVLNQGKPARTKALLRILIGEIRVVSPTDILPTYRVPEVRIPEDLVGDTGLAPTLVPSCVSQRNDD